jgi:hypothetical protein
MRQIKKGSVDQSVVIRIIDSADGTPETGVVFNTSGLDLKYRRELSATVDITEATLAALTTAHADGGFLHIGAGYYRLDLPDAALATGANGVLVFGTCTGMVVIGEYVDLVDFDPQDTVRLGLTALPNVASGSAGAIVTSGTGTAQLSVSSGLVTLAGVTHTGAVIPTVTTATNVTTVNGLAANVITAASINADAITDAKVASDVTIASVTGAVGSVTGNVGGNVTGSVGSVASGGITATSIAADAIGASELAADALAEIADAVWDEVLSGHVTVGTAGQRLAFPRANTAQAGAAGTITLDASASAVDDFYNNDLIYISAGTGVGQARIISDYVGSTKVATVASNWVTNPSSDSVFIIFPGGATTLTGTVDANVVSVSGDTTAADTLELFAEALDQATGQLDSGSLAAGTITAAAVATGAIDADALAADAGTEIGTAVWATTTRLLTAGTNIALAKGTGVTGFNDLSAAQVNTEVDTALTDIHLDHLLAATYDPASKPGAADALLNELVESDAGVARYTANALEQAPTGGSAPTVGQIADAVWDEDLTGHTTPDSAGEILGNVATGTPPTASAIADEVQTRTIAAVTTVNGLAANTVNASALAADAVTELQSGLATASALSSLDTKIGSPAGASVSADIAAIEAQTDDIGVAGAGLTAIPWNATWDAEVESEVADALEATVADSVPADGTRPSVKQALYILTQFMLERTVSGTTCTVRKPDGSTTLLTLTLNDATTPTSVTRAT